ncbi:MAG: sugar-binding protein, partial [Bifidobacteriales bacterium]|nr:sugar-binding protein [Bifidobacteriales bacterium]
MRMNKKRSLIRLIAGIVALSGMVSLSGCGEAARQEAKMQGNEITLWTHTAGSEAELSTVEDIVADYNSSPDRKGTVKIQSFPQSSYNDSVISASTAGNLPCLVDVDQPNTPYWGWANILAPLTDKALLKRTNQLIGSAKGTWNKQIYTVGYFDATTALFARKSVLKDLGIRVATVDRPWTKAEMDDALAKMKASGHWAYPFEMGTADNKTEWYAYAYAPILQSFGGDLVNRKDYQTSQ